MLGKVGRTSSFGRLSKFGKLSTDSQEPLPEKEETTFLGAFFEDFETRKQYDDSLLNILNQY